MQLALELGLCKSHPVGMALDLGIWMSWFVTTCLLAGQGRLSVPCQVGYGCCSHFRCVPRCNWSEHFSSKGQLTQH